MDRLYQMLITLNAVFYFFFCFFFATSDAFIVQLRTCAMENLHFAKSASIRAGCHRHVFEMRNIRNVFLDFS